jgi:integrase
MATGIRKRHSRDCRSQNEGRCNCQAGWEASVYSKRDGKKIRKVFAREAEAKSWRADALAALRRGGLRAPKRTTIRQAWEAWYLGAQAGTVRNRSGDRYKPSAVRGYEQAMRLRVLPEFGEVRLADLERIDLQAFVERLMADGLAPPTIDVTLLPVRAIYRLALERGEIMINPCDKVRLPRSDRRRDRIADPIEAAALIAAVPGEHRPIWAAAMYAGLRRGELQALRLEDVDLAGGVVRAERGWDFKEGAIELKSNAGRRRVPIAAVLRDHLADRVARVQRSGGDLLFGEDGERPFRPESLQRAADDAWEEAGLSRITLHECRHTFASLMIAAGVNAKALQTYMGHANISITLDRYGHLMPGSEEEAAGLLDTYLDTQLAAAAERARGAGGELGAPVVRQSRHQSDRRQPDLTG